MAVQCRRGPWKDFHPEKLRPGEWAFVTSGDPNSESGRSVYACFGPGVVKRMSTYEDMQLNIQNATKEVRDLFTKDIQDAISDAVAATKSANDIVDLLERKLENGDFVGPQGEEGQPGPPGPAGSIENIETATIEFEQASSRNNIGSGETFATILGKVKKWFADLKTVAFTGSYEDLSGKPTIPEAVAVKGNAETSYRTGDVNLTPADIGAVEASKVVESTNITQPGFLMDGKTVSEAFSSLNSKLGKMLYTGLLTKESANINIPEISKYNMFTAALSSSYISGAMIGVRQGSGKICFFGVSVSGSNSAVSLIDRKSVV